MVQEGLPIFVGEVAKYEIKGGHLHVVYRRLGLELVVPISIAVASLAVVGQAIEDWSGEQSGKVEQWRGHAASA
jgi:hypothetical protein